MLNTLKRRVEVAAAMAKTLEATGPASASHKKRDAPADSALTTHERLVSVIADAQEVGLKVSSRVHAEVVKRSTAFAFEHRTKREHKVP